MSAVAIPLRSDTETVVVRCPTCHCEGEVASLATELADLLRLWPRGKPVMTVVCGHRRLRDGSYGRCGTRYPVTAGMLCLRQGNSLT